MSEKTCPISAEELAHRPLPFCATRDDLAPLFTADSYVKGEVKEISLKDYTGKWVILFFYASDFTFV